MVIPERFDESKFELLGKCSAFISPGDGEMYATKISSLSEEERAAVRGAYDVYKTHMTFLEAGKSIIGADFAKKLKPFTDFTVDADGTVLLNDAGSTYAEFRLNWETLHFGMKHEHGFSNEQARRARLSNKQYGMFWAHDTTVSGEEKGYTQVSLFLVDWENRDIYMAMSDMEMASADAKGVLELLREAGSVGAMFKWAKAAERYDAAKHEAFRGAFNPLTDL